MVKPFIVKKGANDAFFWNIDSNVGLNSPNKLEDVQLVQFGYFALGQNPKTDPAEKPVYAAVQPGAAYSGGQNDPLTKAILLHQKTRGGTQDGHVSVIKGSGIYDGKNTFMLIALDNNILDLTRDYPRIDKHAKCPAALKAAVLRTFRF